TAAAGVVGIVGVGFGLWWADAVAAIFISFEVTKDGATHTLEALKDLMDERPMKLKENEPDPLVDRVDAALKKTTWIKESKVRMREAGVSLMGDILVSSTDNVL